MFFPYRLDDDSVGYPALSMLIAVLCVLVFAGQSHDWSTAESTFRDYCETNIDGRFKRVLRAVAPDEPARKACESTLFELHGAIDFTNVIDSMAQDARGLAHPNQSISVRRIRTTLGQHYAASAATVGADLTRSLAYPAGSLDLFRIIGSTLAHADFWHIAGNLLFFAAFAPAVELLVGRTAFALALLSSTAGATAAYSLANSGAADAYGVIGLSGVVSGMMAALVMLWPSAPIRCVLLLIVYPLRFNVPALLLAGAYIGWDVYYLLDDVDSEVSFESHVGGTLGGAAFVLAWWYFTRGRSERETR